ncbi:MAG: TonB-dependent receptor [Cytophagales bacterium]|nr:MAG: TonB-dependent receptor [Cytophagales bacterium]
MYLRLLFCLLFCGFAFSAPAQAIKIEGVILETVQDNQQKPLAGAAVYWLGKAKRAVQTDSLGRFGITQNLSDSILIVSFVGYVADTVKVKNSSKALTILLETSSQNLNVTVDARTAQTDAIQQKEMIRLKDLRKAACCNLSESFETNATVDVSNMDALTGTKQVRMLGLDGVYTQIMLENVSSLRGLAARSGLRMIPGAWIKSIDITKGSGSVVYGYESLAGQMNLQLHAPEHQEKIHLNAYLGFGRLEGNSNYSYQLNKKWSAATLLHASYNFWRQDNNHDGFLDVPNGYQYNGVQRFRYDSKNFVSQTLIQAVKDKNLSGETRFSENEPSNAYGVVLNQERVQFISKNAFLSQKSEEQSLGIVVSGIHHNSDNHFGLRSMQGQQNTLMANIIFQTCFGVGKLLRTGANLVYDHTQQKLWADSSFYDFSRKERVGGVFGEFTRSTDHYGIIIGMRADYHNLKGLLLTPRLNLRYNINPRQTLLLSGGRGFRYANIISDNLSYFISGRAVSLPSDANLEEDAWNMGANWSYSFGSNEEARFKGKLSVDFYRTWFSSQSVVDLETAAAISIYALQGQSYANSLHANLELNPHPRFELSTSYKYYHIKTTYRDFGERELPLVAQHRAMLNMAYKSQNRRWLYDLTFNAYSSKRLMPTFLLLPRDSERSPAFLIVNAQITRKFLNQLEIYLGGENLLNVMQHDLIIGADAPFSRAFDAARVWGPSMGSMAYLGLRWTLDKPSKQ